MTVLREAFREACARRDMSDEAGDYDEARLLGGIADVLDQASRIADVTDSALYRAEKCSELVHAALLVRREALLSYAGPLADDLTFDCLHDLTKLAIEIEDLIGDALWAWAERRPADDEVIGDG